MVIFASYAFFLIIQQAWWFWQNKPKSCTRL